MRPELKLIEIKGNDFRVSTKVKLKENIEKSDREAIVIFLSESEEEDELVEQMENLQLE